MLAEMTGEFSFSEVSGEPSKASENEIRLFRLKALINQVRQMAVRKFYQMPESFRVMHTMEDWIQDAVILLWNLCSTYDPERAPFNNYARFIATRRLTDIQRGLFRKNPPVYDELKKIEASLKGKKGGKPTIEDMAEFMGLSERQVRKIIERGVGQRIVSREGEGDSIKEVKTGWSPEEQYIRLEARKILWGCIDLLEQGQRTLFIYHELEKVSHEKLYDNPGNRKILECRNGSLSTFKRRYGKIYDRVRDCLHIRYARRPDYGKRGLK